LFQDSTRRSKRVRPQANPPNKTKPTATHGHNDDQNDAVNKGNGFSSTTGDGVAATGNGIAPVALSGAMGETGD
jgi:hypothetical protein